MGIIVTIAIVGILACLGAAGYFLLQGGAGSGAEKNNDMAKNKRMARALGLRVALSIALFLGIMLSWAMGWIAPTGLPA